MAIKDVLLPLFGNPSPAVIAAITKCVDVAEELNSLQFAAKLQFNDIAQNHVIRCGES